MTGAFTLRPSRNGSVPHTLLGNKKSPSPSRTEAASPARSRTAGSPGSLQARGEPRQARFCSRSWTSVGRICYPCGEWRQLWTLRRSTRLPLPRPRRSAAGSGCGRSAACSCCSSAEPSRRARTCARSSPRPASRPRRRRSRACRRPAGARSSSRCARRRMTARSIPVRTSAKGWISPKRSMRARRADPHRGRRRSVRAGPGGSSARPSTRRSRSRHPARAS